MTDSQKKILETQKDLDDTKKILETNVENLIARAELLEKLDETTKDLRHQTQEFALHANELKTALNTRNYIYGGIILFGIGGSLYGVWNGYSPASCLMTGMFGSALGGVTGYYAGTIKAFFGKLAFAYQLQDSPFKALKDKFSAGLKDKLKPSNMASLTSQAGNKNAPNQSHHEQEMQPLEISKTLTQWFEAKKHEKQEGTKILIPEKNVAKKRFGLSDKK